MSKRHLRGDPRGVQRLQQLHKEPHKLPKKEKKEKNELFHFISLHLIASSLARSEGAKKGGSINNKGNPQASGFARTSTALLLTFFGLSME